MGLTVKTAERIVDTFGAGIWVPPVLNIVIKAATRSIQNKALAIRGILSDSKETHFTKEPRDKESSEWLVWKLATEGREAALKVIEEIHPDEKLDSVQVTKQLLQELSRLRSIINTDEFTGRLDRLEDPIARAGIRYFVVNIGNYIEILEFAEEKGLSSLNAREIFDNLVPLAKMFEKINERSLTQVMGESGGGAKVLEDVFSLIHQVASARYDSLVGRRSG